MRSSMLLQIFYNQHKLEHVETGIIEGANHYYVDVETQLANTIGEWIKKLRIS